MEYSAVKTFPVPVCLDNNQQVIGTQLNLVNGHWMEDHTCLQRHVGGIIAYNIYYYVQVTGDIQFLADFGAELFLEIARFWASIAEYNAELDRYEINGVVGPDEYHTQYPDAPTPGLRNNTYTNILAVWTLCKAHEILKKLSPEQQQQVQDKLELPSEVSLSSGDKSTC